MAQERLSIHGERESKRPRKQQQQHRPQSLGEDEALASEHLFQTTAGNVHTNKWNLLVALTRGNGTKLSKARQQTLDKRRKSLEVSSSDSWRGAYQIMFLSPMAHQFLAKEVLPPPASSADPTALDENGHSDLGNVVGNTSEDLKGVWRAILSIGKALEERLQYESKGKHKPLLSTVATFLSKAYELPRPETCFGTHHVIIDELSSCLMVILEHIDIARCIQAKLRDMIYQGDTTGVDIGALKKFLETEAAESSIALDEEPHYVEFSKDILKWQSRCNGLLDKEALPDRGQDDLVLAEGLLLEARSHGFVAKSVVELKSRIDKAYELRARIMAWEDECRMGTKGLQKAVTLLVKDCNRLGFSFSEVVKLMDFNTEMEAWIERANIAIRSRISLDEIKELVSRGEAMPLDLTEYLDKLNVRVSAAEQWLVAMTTVVPTTSTAKDGEMLPWIKSVRVALSKGRYSDLHDLSSDGSRIPVEVLAVKVLQVELDAKNWTTKAKKWIPSEPDSRKGKVEELREHLEKGEDIRERLILSPAEKEKWILEGEEELLAIVDAADEWFDKVRPVTATLCVLWQTYVLEG